MAYADALLGIITLVLFTIVFYGPWQDACTDWTRQKIFEIRDRLFDMARRGDLDFSSPEYRAVREGLQAQIRFCHYSTLPFIIWHLLFLRDLSRNAQAEATDKISDPVIRKEVKLLVDQATREIIIMAGYKSIFGLPIVLMATLVKPLGKVVTSISRPYYADIRREAELTAC